MQQIPEIKAAPTIQQFIQSSLNTIKDTLSLEAFKQKAEEIGFSSRASFRHMARGQRQFPLNKIPLLAKALDMSFAEERSALDLTQRLGMSTGENSFSLGQLDILSHPRHTIVMAYCGLNQKMNVADIQEILKIHYSAREIQDSITLLLQHRYISSDTDGHLSRLVSQPISLPPGVKVESARLYINESLDFAKKTYDLDLCDREYTAFSARIKREDFPKLKDLVRNFRKEVYALSKEDSYDTVVHINVTAALLNSESQPKL